jgi:hypothetical protein
MSNLQLETAVETQAESTHRLHPLAAPSSPSIKEISAACMAQMGLGRFNQLVARHRFDELMWK